MPELGTQLGVRLAALVVQVDGTQILNFSQSIVRMSSSVHNATEKKNYLGDQVFRCRKCKRTFNQRKGTPFNFLEAPTDILFQVLLCRLRYKMSFRDLAEFLLSSTLSI